MRCHGGEQVSGIVDFVMEASGVPTPEQAVQGWMQPSPDEHLALDERASTAELFVVRVDGTVSGVLRLQRTSSGGRVVGAFEGCAGEFRVRPPGPDAD